MVQSLWPPPEVIESWPAPNYIDPPNRGPGLVYCSIIFPSLGLLVVAARLYSRYAITKAPGFDDLLAVFGAALGIALSVFCVIGNKKFHSGYHIWDIPYSYGPGSRLNAWISQWLYLWSTSMVKISVLLFHRRISVSFNRPFYYAVWAGILYNLAQVIGFSIALLTICQPTSAYWLSFDIEWLLRHSGNRHCTYEGWSLTFSGILSCIGDFYAAVLPSFLVLTLQMPRRQKLAVVLLFAVGFAVVGLGIGRTIMMNRVVLHGYDSSWVLWEAWIWAIAELWVGLMAASAPSLKPFFQQLLVDPISDAMHSSAISAWKRRRTPGHTSASSRSKGDRSWIFLPSHRSKLSSHQDTTASYADSKNGMALYAHETVQWPMPPSSDTEKGHARTSFIAMPPTPAMHNYRYEGGGICWSDAAPVRPQRTSSRRSITKRLLGSTTTHEDEQQSTKSRSATLGRHRRFQSADSAAVADRMTSQQPYHKYHSKSRSTDTDIYGYNSSSPVARSPITRLDSPTEADDEISPAMGIDRTVEWTVLDERAFDPEPRSPSPTTRSVEDLEERVEHFGVAS